jgi:hypothetical protein
VQNAEKFEYTRIYTAGYSIATEAGSITYSISKYICILSFRVHVTTFCPARNVRSAILFTQTPALVDRSPNSAFVSWTAIRWRTTNACDECGRWHLRQISCSLYKAQPHFLVLRIASVNLVISYWEICGFAAVLTTRIGCYLMGTELVDIQMVMYMYYRHQEEMFDCLM